MMSKIAKMDENVAIAINFSEDHWLEWGISRNMQEHQVVASLIWVGFKELLVERFTKDCQELRKDMNLVQMRHTWRFKA